LPQLTQFYNSFYDQPGFFQPIGSKDLDSIKTSRVFSNPYGRKKSKLWFLFFNPAG
jgi:hypothetical protein